MLELALDLRIETLSGFDTDRFGTFSRDVERSGSQLDAARAKIAAAFDCVPEVRIAIASEGSFGPHPDIPFLPLGRELVLLSDRDTGLELAGHHASPDTNFGHAVVTKAEDALAFATKVGFPEHGVIVMGYSEERPDPRVALSKDITSARDLEAAVELASRLCGAAFVEADMRAHRNPTRMAAIGRAASDLVRRYHSRCPTCAWRGFDVVQRVTGMLCAWCGEPTTVIRAEILGCAKCGLRVERAINDRSTADPGQCANCNP